VSAKKKKKRKNNKKKVAKRNQAKWGSTKLMGPSRTFTRMGGKVKQNQGSVGGKKHKTKKDGKIASGGISNGHSEVPG